MANQLVPGKWYRINSLTDGNLYAQFVEHEKNSLVFCTGVNGHGFSIQPDLLLEIPEVQDVPALMNRLREAKKIVAELSTRLNPLRSKDSILSAETRLWIDKNFRTMQWYSGVSDDTVQVFHDGKWKLHFELIEEV